MKNCGNFLQSQLRLRFFGCVFFFPWGKPARTDAVLSWVIPHMMLLVVCHCVWRQNGVQRTLKAATVFKQASYVKKQFNPTHCAVFIVLLIDYLNDHTASVMLSNFYTGGENLTKLTKTSRHAKQRHLQQESYRCKLFSQSESNLAWRHHEDSCSEHVLASADILKDSLDAYTADDVGKYKTIVKFDCRGVSPVEYSPRVSDAWF